MRIAPDTVFRILADPSRRAIFERLVRDGEQTALTGHSGVSGPPFQLSLRPPCCIGMAWSTAAGGQNEKRIWCPAITSAAGDVALAACRPDRRHVVRWVSLVCADAQHRSPEDRHSADPYVRRDVDLRPDGRPLNCPNADVETGGCDDR